MSLTISLKQLIYQTQGPMNNDKYFLFQLKSEIKLSKIIKKNEVLNDSSKYQFELDKNNNRLEIQLWEYDYEGINTQNIDKNLLGVGNLDIPDENFNNSYYSIEDQEINIYDPIH